MLGSVPGRLAGMMFLQYFGLSATIVPLTRYLQTLPVEGGLGFSPGQVGSIYMTFAVGAIVSPLVVGLLADRWFAVEKVIAGTHAVMAVLMTVASRWCDSYDGTAADPADAVGPLFALILGYAIGMQITLTLSTVISFRNLSAGDGVFWYVRLVGTFGWIVAGVVVGWVLNPISPQPLYVAAATSAVLAGFALSLPHTPPKGYGRPIGEVIGLPAVKMFRDRSFVIFAGVLFLCNTMNQFYSLFVSPYLKHLGVQVDLGNWGNLAPEVVMTLAQWCEIACMAATPWLMRHVSLEAHHVAGSGRPRLAKCPAFLHQRARHCGGGVADARLGLRVLQHDGLLLRGSRSTAALACRGAIAGHVPRQRTRRAGGQLARQPYGWTLPRRRSHRLAGRLVRPAGWLRGWH